VSADDSLLSEYDRALNGLADKLKRTRAERDQYRDWFERLNQATESFKSLSNDYYRRESAPDDGNRRYLPGMSRTAAELGETRPGVLLRPLPVQGLGPRQPSRTDRGRAGAAALARNPHLRAHGRLPRWLLAARRLPARVSGIVDGWSTGVAEGREGLPPQAQLRPRPMTSKALQRRGRRDSV
jgi:hypothetical protein